MARRLFLTSGISYVARAIYREIKRDSLKVLFIDTAAEVEKGDLSWLEDDKRALENLGYEVNRYSITGKAWRAITVAIQDHDVVVFSGGNQFYLMNKIRETECADSIINFVNKGGIYIGESAGSEIAGTNLYPTYIEEDVESAGGMDDFEGLGLVDFTVFPHWGSDDFRDRYLKFRMEHAYTENDRIILLTNYQYISVVDDCFKIVDVPHFEESSSQQNGQENA